MKRSEMPFRVVRDDGIIYSHNRTRKSAEREMAYLLKYGKSKYHIEEVSVDGNRDRTSDNP